MTKISKAHLDRIIKEEALKIKAEMLKESQLDPRQQKLMEEKQKLEKELSALNESPGLEEGIFGSLFGGGDKGAARKDAVLKLLKHPNKSKVLLTYASPEQVAEFRTYLPPGNHSLIDVTLKQLRNKAEDPARAESYIKFFMDGGNNPSWNAASHQYMDAGQISGSASSAFSEGEGPQG